MRKRAAWKQGSITIYLSLSLSVLLALLFASVHSARIAAGRVVLASSLEQSLYSVFGMYDKELFDRFGLLFIDAGRGSDRLRLGTVLGEVETFAGHITDPAPGGRKLIGMSEPSADLQHYTLATDDSAAAFRRQVATAVRESIATDAVTYLRDRIVSGERTAREQVRELEAEAPSRSYASDVHRDMQNGVYAEDAEGTGAHADGQGETDAVEDTFTQAEHEAAEAMDLGEDYGDPIDTVDRIRSLGILNLAVPEGRDVSGAQVQLEELADHRALQRGVGVIPTVRGGADRFLCTEYAMRHLSSFTGEEARAGLRYRVEYLVGGKGSDAENLRAVLDRLTLIREASNFVFLSVDPQKRAETLAAATAVCSACMVPFLAPVVAIGIRAAWAYAESICDLRDLLAGGKVPIVKTAASWHLSVEQLPSFDGSSTASDEDSGEGLDYEQYLRMLLLATDSDTLTERLMAMVEHTMRRDCEQDAFRIDNCVDAMTVQIAASVDGIRIERTEHYGYGTSS